MKLLLVLFMAAFALGERVNYQNYKVYRFVPKTEQQRQVLLDLQEHNPGLVFWKHVRGDGLPVDIMFPPHLLDLLEEFKGRVAYEEMIPNVQSLIDIELMAEAKKSPRLSWDAYYSVDDIYAYLDEVHARHPNMTSLGSMGTSFEGRQLRYIHINKGNTDKPVVWFDANIHAREWITNPVATWVIKELLEGGSTQWLDRFNFYIAPMMNPDGYEYSRNTNRMWRKTRSNYGGGTCRGADPNRNFQFMWNTGGSSADPCSDTYRGASAGSENEVQAAMNMMAQVGNKTVLHISLHSYSQLILISYGNPMGRVYDHDEHMTIGNAAAAAIRQRYGTNFTPGNIVELLYVASGGSGDHMKGVYDTDVAFTFELRDTGRYGFILPPDQIVPSCLEFMDGFHVILQQVANKKDKETVYFR